MTRGTWAAQLSVTSQEPPLLFLQHLLNFQVCVKPRNRQLDNMAFISHPESLHNQAPGEKKTIERQSWKCEANLSNKAVSVVPCWLNIAQQPLSSPFRHEFVTWE